MTVSEHSALLLGWRWADIAPAGCGVEL